MRFLFIFLLVGIVNTASSQYHLQLEGDPLPEGIRVDREYPSGLERRNALSELVRAAWSEGYLAASMDSVRSVKDTLIARFHRGQLYRWGKIGLAGTGKGMMLDAGVDPQRLREERIDPQKVSELFEKILSHCERNGYPFAEVRLDSLEHEGKGVQGLLALDKGPLVRLDSVIIKGDDAVHRSFLQQYLGLKPGMLYDEESFQRIDPRLRNLSFLEPSSPSELLFTEEGVTVYLHIAEKDASRFNGMVGLQPKEEGEGVTLTGDLTLGLKNALRRGEKILLDWDRMQVGTQDLSVSYDHPYLFNTPFGVEAGLKLYKKDSSFTELEQRIALKYLFSGEDHFRVQYQRKKWTLLKGGDRARKKDLPFADLRVDAYGVGFQKSTVDRRILPRKGVRGELEGSVGRKELLGERPSFVDEGKGKKVDSTGPTLQYEVKGHLEAFYPLLPRLILMGGIEGGWLKAPYLVENELYRIGGHGSLRGVDKEGIRASTYSIGTIEVRYLLEAQSDLHVFFDGAYHEDRSGGDLTLDRPFGFGFGSRFKTKAGIFNIDYALGQRFDNPIRLRNGRVHFGFTSLF
ncbi:MAG: hypothetical protein ABEH38_10125 [Flavobacteriales bacterium]